MLAPGKLARLALLHPFQTDETKDLYYPPFQHVATHGAATEAEGDVLEHREMRKEGVGLEDRVHVALVRRQPADLFAGEVDGALGGLLEATDHP